MRTKQDSSWVKAGEPMEAVDPYVENAGLAGMDKTMFQIGMNVRSGGLAKDINEIELPPHLDWLQDDEKITDPSIKKSKAWSVQSFNFGWDHMDYLLLKRLQHERVTEMLGKSGNLN